MEIENGHDSITKIHEYFNKQKLDKRMFNNNSNFDIDLKFGQIYEKTLALILKDEKLEVKTERDKWKDTGNIAIELFNHNKGKPSGLSITKANFWVTILVHNFKLYSIHILPVDYLKQRVKDIVKSGKGKVVMGGDFNCSEMALIPIKEIFGYAPNN